MGIPPHLLLIKAEFQSITLRVFEKVWSLWITFFTASLFNTLYPEEREHSCIFFFFWLASRRVVSLLMLVLNIQICHTDTLKKLIFIFTRWNFSYIFFIINHCYHDKACQLLLQSVLKLRSVMKTIKWWWWCCHEILNYTSNFNQQ